MNLFREPKRGKHPPAQGELCSAVAVTVLGGVSNVAAPDTLVIGARDH
jgi:hypothetical protein